MRITDQNGGVHYFNNDNLAKMQIGNSKTMMMLEASRIDLVYIATADSGNDIDLKNYSLVFKRLNLMQIQNFMARYAGIAPFFLILGILITFGLCIYCFFYKRHYAVATK